MSNIANSKYWGPHAWYLIHSITRNLVKLNPSEEPLKTIYQEAISEFFITLLLLMPCGICQKNYLDKLDEDSFKEHLEDWGKIDEWGHNLHNSVNKMLEKPELSYKKYQNMYQKKNSIKLLKYPEILFEFHIKSDISLSEIQNVKRYLEALMILYPLRTPTIDGIRKGREEIKAIYDYNSLETYYKKWIRSVS